MKNFFLRHFASQIFFFFGGGDSILISIKIKKHQLLEIIKITIRDLKNKLSPFTRVVKNSVNLVNF